MTINLFFITINVQKRKKSKEELEHDERIHRIMEEVKDRQFKMYRGF